MFECGVLKTIRRAEYAELMGLFFLLAMAMGMWGVPLSAVLDAHGYTAMKPFAFATSAIAAFVSPLIFGAIADRHATPATVLRHLSLAVGAALALASTAVRQHAPEAVVLGSILLLNLCQAPAWSIANALVFSRLAEPEREFGPIRSFATFGWMGGCWIVSLLGADTSTLSGYAGAVGWVLLSLLTRLLPQTPPPAAPARLTLRQRMGWDALVLLRNRDHRVVFITTALFSIPLAAYLPYTPPHLRELGLRHLTAWMSLGQITELVSMFSLAWLFTRWRVKWIFTLGLSLGITRFALCALDREGGVLGGVFLHGCSFTLVMISAQIYLNERVAPEFRARAQALMSLMTSGVGSLVGFLSSGAWFAACTPAGGSTRWTIFWLGLSGTTALVLLYFLFAYHGIGKPPGARLASPPTERR